MIRRLWVMAGVVALAWCGMGRADNWPGWRGPHGDGVALEHDLPIHWSDTGNVHWKTALPGKGHSSPIVWGNRIFVTTCREKEGQRVLMCLDRRDGKLMWEKVVMTAPLEPKHSLNSFASSTPATDGTRVWVTFLDMPNFQVVCFDMQGHEIWRKSPGKFFSKHGFCSPPILYRDLVILNGDQDALAYLVALDQATGTERWRADRPNRTRSYCPPLIIHAAEKNQMVLSGSKCVASYDPDTGKQLWIIDGPTEQFVASMVYTDGVLLVSGGFPEFHLLGIRPDGAGDVTNTHVLWHERKGASYVPSPIARGKYFFVVADNGIASCFEAKTGKRLWMEHLGRHHSASPVLAGQYIYFVDDDGQTFVLNAGPRFQVVSKNPLHEESFASPAISQAQLFIRTLHHLYCIGSAATVAAPNR